MSHRDQSTRERAHELWEQEGRPEEREREHWERAAREIEEQEADRDSSDRGALKYDEGGLGRKVRLRIGTAAKC